MLVEDSADIREMMAAALQLAGLRVLTAPNGQAALTILQDRPPPCLILLDLMMPVMNGWEFRRVLEQDAALRDVPVVVVSAATGEIVKNTPADAFLAKPIDMDRLLHVVCAFCNGISKPS